MVVFISLLAGILLLISPATAAIIDASFDEAVLNGLQQLQFTKVGARVSCLRTYDYTHNDQRELMAPSQKVTVTTDRCKKDPWHYNRPGAFMSFEIIAFKDNGERMVCGEYGGTRLRHAANTNPRVAVQAFGGFGGKLAGYTASELGGIASKAAVAQLPAGVPIDSVVYGNVLQTSADAAYLARHVGHRAGLDIKTPALTINRLCGSGFQSIINGAQEILLNEAEIVLTGGTESMSQAPYAIRNVRLGTRYGVDLKAEDTLAHALVDSYPKRVPMGITAENLGKKYNLTRKDADEYALSSQHRWAAANEAGHFKEEITPIEVKVKKGTETFAVDEGPRPKSTIESLAKLAPVFVKDTGLVTAGNASGINDGAASLIVASADAVKKHNLKPLARLVSWYYCGVEPEIMGIGPVPAIKGALKRAGLSLKDMSRVEVNEAFAVQYLAVEKELGLDRSTTNSNGGAIALGHPLGTSGARIMAHLTYELHRLQGRYAVGSACIGGGQGIAIVIERA
ncbi:3-ketoacyl-CoA thiolase, mitochondrial [Quaeritorhiza haematococci]|nr:3-ketoacyl-CoA thiolase, mitochondrial [Quaeritorhiza haematococci]